jgi:hypothetical protein
LQIKKECSPEVNATARGRRNEPATPRATRGAAIQTERTRARGAAHRVGQAGPAGSAGAGGRAPPRKTGRWARGSAGMARWRRFPGLVARCAGRPRFWPVQAPGTPVFPPEKHCSAYFLWFCSGSAPSRAVLLRFSTQRARKQRYRRQGGRCMPV